MARLVEVGVAPHVIERLLNHVTGQISRVATIYNRAKFQNETPSAIDLWGARLKSILEQP